MSSTAGDYRIIASGVQETATEEPVEIPTNSSGRQVMRLLLSTPEKMAEVQIFQNDTPITPLLYLRGGMVENLDLRPGVRLLPGYKLFIKTSAKISYGIYS